MTHLEYAFDTEIVSGKACDGVIFFSIYYYYFQVRTAAFKTYCAICVRRSNFRHQASPRVSLRYSTRRRKVELWARNVR
jgi:hypothetical protein